MVSLWFKAWEFAVDVECCVFPDLKDQANYPKEEAVIGDRDCERFDLMRYAKKEIEPIQIMEVVPESEVIDDGLQDVDEVDRDRLNEGKFYHFGQYFGQLTEDLGDVREEWEAQIGDMFPPNSETRKALIEVLDRHVEGETISNLLQGRKLKLTPFSAKLKEGLTFEGVRGRNYSDVQRQVLREWVELMLEEG